MSNKSLVRDFERKRKRSWYDVESVGGDIDAHALASDQRNPAYDEPAPYSHRGASASPANRRRGILIAASEKRGLFVEEIGECGKYTVSERGTRKVFLTNVCYNDALEFIDARPIKNSPGH